MSQELSWIVYKCHDELQRFLKYVSRKMLDVTSRGISAAISVLIVTDDGALVALLNSLLSPYDAAVSVLTPAERRHNEPFASRYDVVCLDRAALTQIDREIGRWRRRWPSSQIVMLNALDNCDARRALNVGADEALTVASRSFDCRVHAVARRARTLNAGARVAIGDVVFDRESRRVWCAGAEVKMTPQECAVLACFFWHSPAPVSVRTLTEFVWDGVATRDVVEVYVGYVRRKLAASQRVLLRTIRGHGYQFVVKLEDVA